MAPDSVAVQAEADAPRQRHQAQEVDGHQGEAGDVRRRPVRPGVEDRGRRANRPQQEEPGQLRRRGRRPGHERGGSDAPVAQVTRHATAELDGKVEPEPDEPEPDELLQQWRQQRRRHQPASACSMSATRSASSSTPIDSRTMPGSMPAARSGRLREAVVRGVHGQAGERLDAAEARGPGHELEPVVEALGRLEAAPQLEGHDAAEGRHLAPRDRVARVGSSPG